MSATPIPDRSPRPIPGWAVFLCLRLLQGVMTLALLSFFCFALFEWIPGDFLTDAAATSAVSTETLDGLRDRYRLDAALPDRYGRWLAGLSRGELGPSLAYQKDAMVLLWPRLGATMLLNLTGLSLALLIALPLAIHGAQRPGSLAARWVSRGMQASLAIPEIVLVLFLVTLAYACGIPLPGGAGAAPGDSGWGSGLVAWVRGLSVPVAALSLGIAPAYYRHMRAAWSEALDEPYVAAARQVGLPPRVVRWRYLFPAVANPLLSLLGNSFGGLLSASLLVETVTGWPGLGPLLLEAAFSRDVHIVVGAVLFAATAQMIGHLAADLAMRRIDPRMRL